MGDLIPIAKKEEIQPGEAQLVEAAGKQIAVFNVDGNYFALDETCTHAGGPLSEGFVEGKTVTCPWHGAQFDLESGEVLMPPAPDGVSCYKVVVKGDEINIETP